MRSVSLAVMGGEKACWVVKIASMYLGSGREQTDVLGILDRTLHLGRIIWTWERLLTSGKRMTVSVEELNWVRL
jgi:hypothetical protein